MNKKLLTLLLSLLFMSCTPPEEPYDTDESTDNDTPVTDIDPNDQINFPDPVLRACIEELTGKGSGDPIYAKDVADITKVDCDGVSDLTGMEYFTYLKTAYFLESSINSLGPIKNNINIKYLSVSGGEVKTLNDIKYLVNLTDITFTFSELEDLSALSNLHKIDSLYLIENKIKNLNSVASLENLESLDVRSNPTLTTLGAQFTVPKLTELNVGSCGLTSLNELSGLPELTSITAGDNYLTDISFITTLPKLGAIGIGGNCLSQSEVQEFVDWWNAKNPEYPKTIEEEMQWQTPEKCQ